MNKLRFCLAAVVLYLAPVLASAQDGYFANWFARVDKTKEEQPHWITPLATTTARLEEEYRYDQLWQTNSAGITTNNYDGGKGLELIPSDKIEVICNAPPYLVHNDPKVVNGLGDVALLVKYRILSSPEKEGNYILTAFMGWSLATGDHKNGALRAIITPTLAYGKGYGDFDVQGTFGTTIPTADTFVIGRTYIWNNTLQYRLFKKLWPEVELNTTFFQGGKNDGNKQNFLTPGLVLGRFRLWGRVGIAVGGGFQVATTHFHSSNHNGIFSLRFPF